MADRRPEPNFQPDPLELTTRTDSQARAAKVLPLKPSQDMGHLLGTIDLPARTVKGDDGRDYLPNEATEWILDINWSGSPSLDASVVRQIFSAHWQEKYGRGELCGFDADRKRWAFLLGGNAPKNLSRLKLAIPLVPSKDHPEPLTVEDYRVREAEAKLRAKSFGQASVTPNLPAEDAVRRARRLRELKDALNLDFGLVLAAPSRAPFDGMKVWDVMLCLGLRWGDMDLFHWDNPSDLGDESFFRVWTSTPPGYFLPEQIAAGKVRVENLIFGFSVPNCARPREVLESMLRGIGYARERLGGTVVDAEGRPADFDYSRTLVAKVADELARLGFPPGSEDARHLF
jgi:cell division protein ZipA